jgi:hypothetical protein
MGISIGGGIGPVHVSTGNLLRVRKSSSSGPGPEMGYYVVLGGLLLAFTVPLWAAWLAYHGTAAYLKRDIGRVQHTAQLIVLGALLGVWTGYVLDYFYVAGDTDHGPAILGLIVGTAVPFAWGIMPLVRRFGAWLTMLSVRRTLPKITETPEDVDSYVAEARWHYENDPEYRAEVDDLWASDPVAANELSGGLA